MKDIILVGSGGCMREIVWQIQVLNKQNPTWNILGYVDKIEPLFGEGVIVGKELIKYLGTDDWLVRNSDNVNVAICIAAPGIRKNIVQKLKENKNIKFPNIILGNVNVCDDIEMGHGCIVSMNANISTNVHIGDYVFINTGCMICHDCNVGDYVTFSPNVTLAGAVEVASECEIGLGAKIIQGIRIRESTIVGAGAVVVRDINEKCTVVGVPAKKILK